MVLVIYNGLDDLSDRAIDLDGFSTSFDGYFLAGNTAVLGVGVTFPDNSVQNGQDAIALYLANGTNFPNNTAVTGTNLVDALVYDTNDPDDPELLAALTPGMPQVDEAVHGASATESMQRCVGGALDTSAFDIDVPTPGAANDCNVCGDGDLDPVEACDDGNDDDTDACPTTCEAARCGDGYVQTGVEACDDGNTDDTDSCPTTCVEASCVTGWSMLGGVWKGVRVSELANLAGVKDTARHVIFEAAHGYTANVRLKEALAPNVMVTHRLDGKPLSARHGAPVRGLVPDLYFWKSAKWITGIRFVRRDAPGYWEVRGYHNHADPWREERHG